MRYLLSALLLLTVVFPVGAASFLHGPYVGAPSETSVTICWLASEPVAARVEYDRMDAFSASGTLALAIDWIEPSPDSDAAVRHEIALTDLDPDSEYAYRVVLRDDTGDTASPIGRFVTAPPPRESVSFLVLADTQWQWEGVNRLEAINDAIAADGTPFDFILHGGDLVESPSSPYWDHWFQAFDDMLLLTSFLPVLGNHEESHRSYYENFVLPPGGGRKDERWWALHWGDVVVVGLDTVDLRVSDYYAEQEWAREHLSGPEPHKFVIFHYPVFSSDAYHGDGYSYDVIFHPIFVETGVDIVFNGHAHNYERIERDGITYLVIGGGGAVPRELLEEHVEGSVVATEGYNFYARVDTSADGIGVEVVSVARATDDTFELTDGHLLDRFTVNGESAVQRIAEVLLVLCAAVGAALTGWFIVRGLVR